MAEERIREAVERGELDDLPGAGRPLRLDDDRLVPEDLRAAYRLLKNAGFLPPELELRREIAEVGQLLACVHDPQARSRAARRLQLLCMRLAEARGGAGDLRIEAAYLDAVYRRLDGRDP